MRTMARRKARVKAMYEELRLRQKYAVYEEGAYRRVFKMVEGAPEMVIKRELDEFCGEDL